MNKIFISYRRGDTQRFARRLHKVLEEEFSDEGVFLDEGGIPAGEDYVEVLRNSIKNAYVFLPLIGKDWLKIPSDDNKPRINDREDVLRREIARALDKGITIVPVLFQNAKMPSKKNLPKDIQELVRFQGVRIRQRSFDDDIQELFNRLDDIIYEKEEKKRKFEEEVDELSEELFGDDEDGNWEPPDLEILSGVRLSQFKSDGEWELEMRAPYAPDAILGPNGRASARFSLVGTNITEGFWTITGGRQGSIEGYIGYQLSETDTGDPRLLGIGLEGLFDGHERFRVLVPIDEIVGKAYHGKDNDGRTYTLKRVGRAPL
jgi:hypothetical protein